MPIEIKELHIRISVNADDRHAPAGGAATTDASAHQALVAECVEHVMRLVRDQKER